MPKGDLNSTTSNVLLAAKAGSFDSSLREDLQRMGHAVTEAFSLIETIASLSRNRIDLLITDLQLDDSAGRSLLEMGRILCPACTIVASTAWAKELLQRGNGRSRFDYTVSSACRFGEIESILRRNSAAGDRLAGEVPTDRRSRSCESASTDSCDLPPDSRLI
jgi:CheY-like chemotaxis protein